MTRWVFAFALVVCGACSLNPQPFPPGPEDRTGDTADASADTGLMVPPDGGGGADSGADSGEMDSGFDAGIDAPIDAPADAPLDAPELDADPDADPDALGGDN